MNSYFKDAPPTKNPSISGWDNKSPAFFPVTDPPYWILIFYEISSDALSFTHDLINLWADWAISGVAFLPVPIAQTGS